jgi:hypothetical protein
MSDREKFRFHDAVSAMLESKLARFVDRGPTTATFLEMYQVIFESLVELFQGSKIEINNESMNWLAQAYYDAVSINNNHDTDPNIFTQRAKLENIPTKELALLATMLNGTPFVIPLVAEVKKRS